MNTSAMAGSGSHAALWATERWRCSRVHWVLGGGRTGRSRGSWSESGQGPVLFLRRRGLDGRYRERARVKDREREAADGGGQPGRRHCPRRSRRPESTAAGPAARRRTEDADPVYRDEGSRNKLRKIPLEV